jgi:N utilization substance protein B
LRNTLELGPEYENEITALLLNWDKERLAMMDLLLMKMAVTELLNHHEIPVKVTLNEYIEIAKLYSTPKSGEFINGILDRLVKNLKESGRIVKNERGRMEESV